MIKKIFIISLLAFVLVIVTALTPLMLMGADTLDKLRYQENPMYAGAELGVGKIKLTGVGIFSWPLPDKLNIASGFGMRFHPILKEYKMHAGIDISANEGDAVLAAGDGVVKFAGWEDGYGNLIILGHKDNLETWYGHNSQILVAEGQSLKGGEKIALAGNTGRSTGPHLHFEVRSNNEPKDPADYIGITADVPEVLPEELRYKKVNVDKVVNWLKQYNSALADKMYVEPIVKAGEFYSVNPLLLVAITGQEESFIPRNWDNADKILRNPFNVGHSWWEYSPGIEKSAMVAAETVVRLSKGRPEGVNPLKWINSPSNPKGLYAEDPGWWLGVSKFFDKLRNEVGYE